MEFIFHFGAQRSKLFLLWIIWLNLPAGKSRECMTSLQISCPDRNIFTRGGIRSTPGGFCGTGHSCCVCVCVLCTLLHAFQGALWHNKGGACHSPPTKESLHSACSWTSLHSSTNFVSQLTFGEKVGPLVRASGPLASCAGVCHTRAQRSHPLTSLPPGAAAYFLASPSPPPPPSSRSEAETVPQFGNWK